MSMPGLQRIEALVIGTSAGGIEALGMLLPALDARCRAAVFVVVHMPRQRPSLLSELFSGLWVIQQVLDKDQHLTRIGRTILR